MPRKLTLAIDDLLQYYSFTGRRDALLKTYKPDLEAAQATAAATMAALLGADAAEEETTDTPSWEQFRECMDFLLDLTEGGLFLEEICKAGGVGAVLGEILGIEKILQVYYEDLGSGNVYPHQPLNADGDPYSISQIVCSTKIVNNEDGSSTPTNYLDAIETGPTDPGAGLNTCVSAPNKFANPSLGAVVMPRLEASIAVRDADAVALFMNGIPTLQMSMCAPFLDIRIITDKPNIGTIISPGDGRLNDMSLMKFLGVYNVKGNEKALTVDYDLASASPDALVSSDPVASIPVSLPSMGADPSSEDTAFKPNISNAGMELFLSPQTLVNANINTTMTTDAAGNSVTERHASGLPPVLDPMQPMMTLLSVNVREQLSGFGIIGFATADIKILLHDRSRMSEIATLLSPQTFSLGSILMEFGWSHPHAHFAETRPVEEQNPYAIFLNSLRTRCKYKLVKSDFTLRNDGQVEITVSVQSQGGAEVPNVHVAEGDYVSTKLVEGIVKRVLTAAMSALDTNAKSIEVLPKQALTADKKTSASGLVPRSVLINALSLLKNVQSAQSDESSADALLEFIKEMVGTDGTGGESVSDANAPIPSLATLLTEKINALDGNISGQPDPWLVDIETDNANMPKFATVSEGAKEPPTNLNESEEDVDVKPSAPYVSLGKIIMSFVGKPMAVSQRYDEVQVLFYGFNPSAGPFGNYSVANFPIPLNVFRNEVMERFQSSDVTLTVKSIMSLLSKMASDPQANPFGFSDAYGSSTETASQSESGGDVSVVDKEAAQKMATMRLITSKFKAPTIKMWIETVEAPTSTQSVENTEGVQVERVVSGLDICRIHIYDENAHPYFSTDLLLDILNDSDVVSSYTKTRADAAEADTAGSDGKTGNLTEAAKMVQKLEEDGLIKIIPGEGDLDTFKQAVDTQTIKKFIMSQTPTISFGTAFSPITNLTVKSSTSGPIANAFMSRAIKEAKEGSSGQEGAGTSIPTMFVTPANVSVECIGCPVIRHGQKLYLDLGTGTTADNLYSVTNVNHQIGPGLFKTTFTLTFTGNSIETFRNNLTAGYIILENAVETDTPTTT